MKINQRDLDKAVKIIKARIEEAVIMRMKRVGEEFVSNARSRGNYQDRTGNLRSSIGYVIIKNGLQLSGSDWIMVMKGGEGIRAGQKLIEEISRKYPTGLVLICVAGMSYAAAVESKGYDVITSSGFIAKEEFKKGIEHIKQKILN